MMSLYCNCNCNCVCKCIAHAGIMLEGETAIYLGLSLYSKANPSLEILALSMRTLTGPTPKLLSTEVQLS